MHSSFNTKGVTRTLVSAKSKTTCLALWLVVCAAPGALIEYILGLQLKIIEKFNNMSSWQFQA